MLAGLPKAPSMYNPVANLQRSRQRQHYVLRRMSELGHITAAQYEDALKGPLRPRREANEYAIHGEYAAEMVRQAMAERYPDEVYSRGFRVYTTLRKADQEAAYVALRRGVSSTTAAAATVARKAMPSCPPPRRRRFRGSARRSS